MSGLAIAEAVGFIVNLRGSWWRSNEVDETELIEPADRGHGAFQQHLVLGKSCDRFGNIDVFNLADPVFQVDFGIRMTLVDAVQLRLACAKLGLIIGDLG